MSKQIMGAVAWAAALFIAAIDLWYLQYKFTGHPGSVELFTTITDWLGLHGHEKAMRIGVGSAELVSAILLLIPWTQVIGAALALAIITGALFFHLVSPLGIDPYGDGGVLFKQACGVFVCSIVILLIRRERALALLERYLPFVPIPTRWRTARTPA